MTVWGAQGENCARYLSKGRPVGIDGRLEWREWQTQDGQKRESVEIIADSVQFLGGREDGGERATASRPEATSRSMRRTSRSPSPLRRQQAKTTSRSEPGARLAQSRPHRTPPAGGRS